MEAITEFKFTVDERYENEKGIFTVVSIHKDEMEILWDNGEKIRTEIDLQRRIQERKQREKIAREKKDNEATGQPRKGGGLKISPKFEGLRPTDFKNTSAKTTWRGRNYLGGMVTKQLPTDNFTFNSWAFAQEPEMHWADVEHRKRDDSGSQAIFFARLDKICLSYGFCVTKQEDKNGSSHDWDSFATWLMQKENDSLLQALAIDNEIVVYDLARPAFGKLLPFADGWRIADGNEWQQVDMLAKYIDSVVKTSGICLAIARKVPRDEALARGQDIAADIAQLFVLLMPLYIAAVGMGGTGGQ
ncbi:conserved hypothetical protein [uncultured Desulfobacterium sp.]|uniref:Uncharacterized protein n=1 Tax=uncultured Desulfobacterium sp. TaxID=201089 RepID=A0A445MYW9_9BACT|nr:conserved hypothetical protein [uncultured Desulfobacterium sp.]